MLKFTVTVEGETQLERAFNRVEKTIEDLTPIWKAVQLEFYAIEKENFLSENASGRSGKWKPLSSPYKEIKASIVPGAGILERTGALVKSLTGENENSVTIIEKQEAAFGTSLPYAKAHQTGGKKLPQRKPIDLSDTQKTRVQKVIQKELLKEIKKTDFKVEGGE